tara:strand:- start:760 stop:921 length:162 start_codon:yes stop_codon:yes gene_type:complete
MAKAGVRHFGRDGRNEFFGFLGDFFELNLRQMAKVGVRHLGKDRKSVFLWIFF